MSGVCVKHEVTYSGHRCGHCLAEERAGFEIFVCTCGTTTPTLESVRVFDATLDKIVRRCTECARMPPHSADHPLWLPDGASDTAFFAQYRFEPLPDGLTVAYCVSCDWALYSDGTVWRVMTWARLADLWERHGAVGKCKNDRYGGSPQ